MSQTFRWANEERMGEMPTPQELEALGWTKLRQHPNYPKSWLMRKDEDEGHCPPAEEEPT